MKGWAAALVAANRRGLLLAVAHRNPIVAAIVVLGAYGVIYFTGAFVLGLSEVRALLSMFSRLREPFVLSREKNSIHSLRFECFDIKRFTC